MIEDELKEEWRQCASKARIAASIIDDASTRSMLQRIARFYDALALTGSHLHAARDAKRAPWQTSPQ